MLGNITFRHYICNVNIVNEFTKTLTCTKMNTNPKEIPQDIPKFLRKVLQDKRDIKEAIKTGKSLTDLAKEKDIRFAKPL